MQLDVRGISEAGRQVLLYFPIFKSPHIISHIVNKFLYFPIFEDCHVEICAVPVKLKSVLVLPHGSADVEHGFSVSYNVLTAECTDMTLQTLNGLFVTKDALQFNDCWYAAWQISVDQNSVAVM